MTRSIRSGPMPSKDFEIARSNGKVRYVDGQRRSTDSGIPSSAVRVPKPGEMSPHDVSKHIEALSLRPDLLVELPAYLATLDVRTQPGVLYDTNTVVEISRRTAAISDTLRRALGNEDIWPADGAISADESRTAFNALLQYEAERAPDA